MNLALMIKPASGACNLRCRYCFYRDITEGREQASYGIMSEETLAIVLKRAFEALTDARNHLTIAFQGGEPLLAGLAYFERFEALICEANRTDVQINRSVQTNGTLIDDSWAAFFAKHGYLVGVSLDGPAVLHDANRIDLNGKGSFSRVTSAIACLKRQRVNFNILTVITRETAKHPQKVYDFLRKNQWDYLQFIPCLDALNGAYEGMSPDPEQYGRFLIETFRAYESELMRGKFVSVRWFDDLLSMSAGRPPQGCGMIGRCYCQFIVEANGNVYPCDFYCDDSHLLGNIADLSLREVSDCPTAHNFVDTSREIPEKCRTCRWYALCRGGCRRYRENADGQPNMLCKSYELFFEACADRLVRLARLLYR